MPSADAEGLTQKTGSQNKHLGYFIWRISTFQLCMFLKLLSSTSGGMRTLLCFKIHGRQSDTDSEITVFSHGVNQKLSWQNLGMMWKCAGISSTHSPGSLKVALPDRKLGALPIQGHVVSICIVCHFPLSLSFPVFSSSTATPLSYSSSWSIPFDSFVVISFFPFSIVTLWSNAPSFDISLHGLR